MQNVFLYLKKPVLTEKELMVAITARGGCLHNTRVHSKPTTAIQALSSWVSYCCPFDLCTSCAFGWFRGKYSVMTVSTNQQKFAYQTTDLCLLLILTYFLSAISHLPQEIPVVWKFWPHLSDVSTLNRVFDGSGGMKVYLHLHFHFR